MHSCTLVNKTKEEENSIDKSRYDVFPSVLMISKVVSLAPLLA